MTIRVVNDRYFPQTIHLTVLLALYPLLQCKQSMQSDLREPWMALVAGSPTRAPRKVALAFQEELKENSG